MSSVTLRRNVANLSNILTRRSHNGFFSKVNRPTLGTCISTYTVSSFSTVSAFNNTTGPRSNTEHEREVMKYLCKVIHPEKKQDIVISDCVTSIQVLDGYVAVSIKLDSHYRALKRDIETVVKQLPWVTQVRVSMAALDADPESTEFLKPKKSNDLLVSASGAVGPRGLTNVKNIIAVSSGKGGVGKSTVSVNLAYTLSKLYDPNTNMPLRVGIFDSDIYGPSLPTMVTPKSLQLKEIDVDGDVRILPLEFQGVKLMSYGYIPDTVVQGKPAGAALRGPMVTQLVTELLTRTNWGHLDYLIIDMPPGTGDIALTLSQTVKITASVVVTTPQKLAFVDVVRGIDFFDQTSVPVLGVVLNKSYFIAPNDPTNEKHYIYGDGSKYINQIQEKWGVTNAYELPLIPAIANTSDNGQPYTLVHDSTTDSTDTDTTAINTNTNKYANLINTSIQTFTNLAEYINETCSSETSRNALQKHVHKLQYNTDTNTIEVHDTNNNNKIIGHIQPRDLRIACRCAGCVHELTGKQILKPERVPKSVKPKTMVPRGQYAVSITWSDGHSSSMYPWTQLHSLMVENKAE